MTAYAWARDALGVRVPPRAALAGDDVLDAVVRAYWARRRGPRCGSEDGYADHRRNGTETCPACRKAHALVTAIRRRRLRVSSGLPVRPA